MPSSKNQNQNLFFSAGLMSGTSMDGIDSSLLITDGETHIEKIGSSSLSYDAKFKSLLKGCEEAVFNNLGDLNKARHDFDRQTTSLNFDAVIAQSTDLHVEVIQSLLKTINLKSDKIDLIGYHGQTLFHSPEKRLTIQVGDGQRLADKTGIAVINDFRASDVAAGGQGAPFAPLYHQALAHQTGLSSVVIANCGGISNITLIGKISNDLYAYDCGPGNALIDRFVRLRTGQEMDTNGLFGSKGKVDNQVLLALHNHAITSKDGSNYLEKKPPKSLDANDQKLIPELDNLSLEDGCATLETFTAQCIVESLSFIDCPIPKLWILVGGGWNNAVILTELEKRLKHKLGSETQIQHAEQIGWDSKTIEAEVFSYLAVRSLRNLPLSVPGTTGVSKPLSGGKIAFPHSDIKKASKHIQQVLG